MHESFSERLLLPVADLPEIAGAAALVVVSGAVLLRSGAHTFDAVLEGGVPPRRPPANSVSQRPRGSVARIEAPMFDDLIVDISNLIRRASRHPRHTPHPPRSHPNENMSHPNTSHHQRDCEGPSLIRR